MPTHDDELNRLLDSLARGTSGEPFELDRATIETASRLMRSPGAPGASPSFVANLEDTLMHRATTPSIVASSRVVDIGEGIGLVAPMPLPRRVQLGRIAALAAVVLLLLGVGGFFRADSENGGGSWLFAPVASASPVPDKTQDCVAPSAASIAEVESANYQPLTDWGVMRYLPNLPGQPITVLPESILPSGESADSATVAAIEPQTISVWNCWEPTIEYGLMFTDITLVSTVQFEDGRVGALVNMNVNGMPVEGFSIFAPLSSGWSWYQSILALPDSELAATSSVNSQTSWKIKMYDVQSQDQQVSNLTVGEIHVQAGQPVELILENIGTVDQRFTIPDADRIVDESIAPGETKTVSVTFAPGWHGYSTIGTGDTFGPVFGYVYAAEPAVSTPIAATPTR